MSGQDQYPVLVSGGSSGLGAALVATLHKNGTPVVVLDKQAPPGPADDFRLVDVSDSAATEQAVQELAERFGGLSGVVTAAGMDRCGPITGVSTADWEQVVKVNLMGTAAVIRAAVPYLERSHGRIVTIASTLGLRPAGDASAYCAAKFGVVGMTRALTMELAGKVGVTLVVPGGMRTAFFDDRTDQYKPADRNMLNPPEYVADSIVHVLGQPAGCEIRELVICHEQEPSWP
ncbi:SDR family oxidoreductase [Actinophytocola xanthii]|uniref:Short-chain dehydrogenase n=1 Tax=Actinophytocola xanthii TaxID=1912961 RepID=A0A1Q8C6K0_9PSEU|nr:SDR family oxidoreductase [Actinophytocola xanthii]OLF09990.1 short-chain dehydrogenase [Actinophytocola xanthii]